VASHSAADDAGKNLLDARHTHFLNSTGMSATKIITYINWLLIAFYGWPVVWALLQPTTQSHEMPGIESIIKTTGLLVLILLVAMNLSSYQWLKITALVLVILMLLIIRWFSDN
jgi:ABC-type uncharacterized transport system ATPase subunit